MDENLPDPEQPDINPALLAKLAEIGEQATRHKLRLEGARMSIGPDGTPGGLGLPPGPLRNLVEGLAAIEELQTPAELDAVKAHVIADDEHNYEPALVRSVTWAMIETVRRSG